MTDEPNTGSVTPEEHRRLGVALFNGTWTLLDKPDRTREEDDRMLHMAHASRYHWGEVGEPVNLSIGEWQIARVYSVLGRAEPALFHASRSLDHARTAGEEDTFHVGAAHESLARAYSVSGDLEEARRHAEKARSIAERLEDEEDGEVLLQDLSTLPLE